MSGMINKWKNIWYSFLEGKLRLDARVGKNPQVQFVTFSDGDEDFFLVGLRNHPTGEFKIIMNSEEINSCAFARMPGPRAVEKKILLPMMLRYSIRIVEQENLVIRQD